MDSKIIGYLLITIGVAIIIFTGLNVYSVVTKKTQPITIFGTETFLSGNKTTNGNLLSSLNVSSDSMIYTSNLLFHVFIAGFAVNIGFRIASLGTQLVRPIIVPIKTKPEAPKIV